VLAAAAPTVVRRHNLTGVERRPWEIVDAGGVAGTLRSDVS